MRCFSCKLNFKDKNMDIYRAWDMSFCSNCYYNLNQILDTSNNNNIWGEDENISFEKIKEQIKTQIQKKRNTPVEYTDYKYIY